MRGFTVALASPEEQLPRGGRGRGCAELTGSDRRGVGAGGGGIWGKVRDKGIPDDELKRIGESIAEGSSAIIAVAEDRVLERLQSGLEGYRNIERHALIADASAELSRRSRTSRAIPGIDRPDPRRARTPFALGLRKTPPERGFFDRGAGSNPRPSGYEQGKGGSHGYWYGFLESFSCGCVPPVLLKLHPDLHPAPSSSQVADSSARSSVSAARQVALDLDLIEQPLAEGDQALARRDAGSDRRSAADEVFLKGPLRSSSSGRPGNPQHRRSPGTP